MATGAFYSLLLPANKICFLKRLQHVLFLAGMCYRLRLACRLTHYSHVKNKDHMTCGLE